MYAFVYGVREDVDADVSRRWGGFDLELCKHITVCCCLQTTV